MNQRTVTQIARFGIFEADLRSHELRKRGVKVKLQEQPFQVLATLLEHPGEVVSREELRRRIWPSDTFVDFDNGLNGAVNRLREALGDSADSPRFVETLPRQGYRFLAAVEDATPIVGSGVLPKNGAGQAGAAVPRKTRRLAFVIGAALAVAAFVAVAAFWISRRSYVQTPPPENKVMLAVLPFENLSGDPDQEYFSDGLTEELLTDLGSMQPDRLAVIARSSVMRYKHSNAPVSEISRQLAVDYVLEGSVRHDRSRVRVSAQLIRARDQVHVWAQNYDYQLSDILGLQATVSQAIANEIRLNLAPERQLRLKSRPSVNPTAYEAYLRGRNLWFHDFDPDICPQTRGYFETAIAADPTYAPAYSGLADYYILCGGLYEMVDQKEVGTAGENAAMKAVTLDPSQALTHNTLAGFLFNMKWDCAGADAESKMAVSLDPNFAEAHNLYSYILASCGQPDQAIVEAQKAHALDPLNRGATLSKIYYDVRKFELAASEAERELALDPESPALHWLLFRIFAAQHKYPDSFQHLREAVRISGDPQGEAELESAYRGGDFQRVLRVLAEQTRASRGQTTMQIAEAYALSGDRQHSLEWLERAYKRHSAGIVWIRTYPAFDFLASDPQFQALLRRIGLPEPKA